MRHWVTYSDGAYLSRLKVLHASMLRHCQPFELDVLCWDDAVFQWAEYEAGEEVVPIRASKFLAAHPELELTALPGPPRTHVEHMWTCGPAYIADTIAEVGPCMYVDADIMFFSSPEPVFEEIGDAPAAVFPHNFADQHSGLPGPTFQSHHVYGLYNVGLVYIAQEEIARGWSDQCVEWCYDRVEHVPIEERRLRYADQKYLDAWPEGYGAHVVFSRAAAVAPWNIHTRDLKSNGGRSLLFGGERLISYHYSSFKELPHGGVQFTRPEYQITNEQAALIYLPYIEQMEKFK